MKYRHMNKGYVISINAKHGKPLLNKSGLVTASGSGYKGLRMFPVDVLDEKFEVIA